MTRGIVMLFAVVASCSTLFAEEPNPEPARDLPAQLAGWPNLVMKTWGGTQFWTDELVFHNWRIQRNVYSEHYRLLDDQNYRRAWGSLEDCLARFEQLKKERELEPISGKVVITLHGICRPRTVMDGLNEYLEDKGDYTTVNVSYASSRQTLDEHAQGLAQIMKHLDEATEIDFVCHSLGNLVVRRYLTRCAEDPDSGGIDPRIKRMVMLGPPNQGAAFARAFRDNKLYGLLLGPSGKELAGKWSEVEKRLATPPFQFAIIAGTNGVNPLIKQENDIFVGVDETKLPGARDFMTVPLLHGELMDDPQCQECVLRFLQEGHLVSEKARQPLTSPSPQGAASK